MERRNNGNGQANSCPNVNGTPYAANFAGTPYTTVPAGAKTADINFRFANSTLSLRPYAIKNVYITTGGTTTLIANSPVGPAGVPVVSGSDVLVTYCVYGVNLPNAGILSLELINPETGAKAGFCSYDASCNAGCAIGQNPIVLPLGLSKFRVKGTSVATILQWDNGDDLNNITGFDVEKSTDGSTFTKIGFTSYTNTPGAGFSTYEFKDTDITTAEKLYYRIRILYMDGSYRYSSIELLHAPGSNENILVSSDGKSVTVKKPRNLTERISINVYNTQGQLIFKTVSEQQQYTLQHLKAGHYFIEIQATTRNFAVRKAIHIF
jgi:hypothetical protein